MLDSGPGASADSNSDVTLAQDEWLDDGALTDAGEALIGQRSRDLARLLAAYCLASVNMGD